MTTSRLPLRARLWPRPIWPLNLAVTMRSVRLVPVIFLTALFVVLCGWSGPAQAQKPKSSRDDTTGRLPPEGSDKLEKEYRAKATEFKALAKGEKEPTKADADVIDLG